MTPAAAAPLACRLPLFFHLQQAKISRAREPTSTRTARRPKLAARDKLQPPLATAPFSHRLDTFCDIRGKCLPLSFSTPRPNREYEMVLLQLPLFPIY